MKPEAAISFAAAVLLHAALLGGLWLGTPARPLAFSEEPPPMDLSLIMDPPEAPPSASLPAPIPVPPAPQPIPEITTPSPGPEPIPQPETIPEPPFTPVPAQTKPAPHHQGQRHFSMPHSAAGTAATLAGAGNRGATGGVPSSRAGYRSNPKPDYPEQARRLHQEGVVVVSVEIGEDGRANEVTLKRSSGFPLLDEAAIQAVRRWIFEPARAAGIPVSSRVDVPVRFSLSR